MGSSTSSGLRYPASTDVPNIAQDIQNLATDVQAYFAPAANAALTKPVLTTAVENAYVQATAMTGTIAVYAATNTLNYFTSNATGSFTLNLTYSQSTTINNILSLGQAITYVVLNTNGSTPYYLTGLQIDGTSVTPKWQGGIAPSAGNASAIDAYNFTLIKTANATFTVLASLTKFA